MPGIAGPHLPATKARFTPSRQSYIKGRGSIALLVIMKSVDSKQPATELNKWDADKLLDRIVSGFCPRQDR